MKWQRSSKNWMVADQAQAQMVNQLNQLYVLQWQVGLKETQLKEVLIIASQDGPADSNLSWFETKFNLYVNIR